MHTKFLTNAELKTDYGIKISRRHRKRLERAGLFPKAAKWGDGPTAQDHYVQAEIEDWIANRLAARDLPKPPTKPRRRR